MSDPAERERLADLLEQSGAFALDRVMLATVPSRADLGGRQLAEAAHAAELTPAELVLELIDYDGSDVSMVAFGMAEADVRKVLAHPRVVAGSDGWTMSADAAPYAHPRSFAYAVRLLARYVRDEALFNLRDAIVKLSTLPARRMGLAGRGVIEPGAIADIVVLDLISLSEESSFEAPMAYPMGIDHVFVAGSHALAAGVLTDVRAGRVLRRSTNGRG